MGQVACKNLAEKFPNKVIMAGRNFKKAQEFSSKIKWNVTPLQFDTFFNHEKSKVLDDVSLVIMCIDQKNTRFIETCFKKGIDYIDVTASHNFLSKVEDLNTKAKEENVTSVLSVGVSPGLTNLLAKNCDLHFDKLEKVNIYLMLGLGDKHGKAAIKWMFDNMGPAFNVVENGSLKKVKSFEDGKNTVFSNKLGQRTSYRFDFADQHIVPNTLGVNSVSTRLCFDSKFSTQAFAVLKKIGFFYSLKISFLKSLFIKIFERFQFGSDMFMIKVDSVGEKDGKTLEYSCSITGEKEGEITGKVASIVAEYIYKDKFPAGVYHIEQLFEPKDIIDLLGNSIKFSN